MRRLATSCFGKIGDVSYYHLPATAGTLAVVIYRPQSGIPNAADDYEQIIAIAANQSATSAAFLSKIIVEGLHRAPCKARNGPGESGVAILHYQRRTLVNVPRFVGEPGRATIAKVGALKFQVYKQAVVVVPLPNDSDLFASLPSQPDRAFCITCPAIVAPANPTITRGRIDPATSAAPYNKGPGATPPTVLGRSLLLLSLVPQAMIDFLRAITLLAKAELQRSLQKKAYRAHLLHLIKKLT